jgi:NADPH:quinone reductase-like Zn-dependent oxidoreductase
VVVDGEGLAERVAAATGGAVARLGLDAVGGTSTARISQCVGEGGVVVNYGRLSGDACEMAPEALIYRGVSLTGFWLNRGLRDSTRDQVTALYADLAARVVAGGLAVAIAATYSIDDIKAALEHAAQGGRDGKILVTPNGSLSTP